MGYAQEFQTPHRLAQGKPTNVDFQNPFMDPVEFSLQASSGSRAMPKKHGEPVCWS